MHYSKRHKQILLVLAKRNALSPEKGLDAFEIYRAIYEINGNMNQGGALSSFYRSLKSLTNTGFIKEKKTLLNNYAIKKWYLTEIGLKKAVEIQKVIQHYMEDFSYLL